MQEARSEALATSDHRLRYGVIAVLVLAADQLTKTAVTRALEIGESIPIVEGALYLSHVRNSGAAFGLLRGMGGLLALAATVGVVVFAAVIVKHPPPPIGIGAGLVVGGALGNLFDRVFRPWPLDGTVVDFVDFVVWPAFNVADAAITVGAGILVLAGFLHAPEEQQERHTGSDGDPPVHDHGG